MRFGVQAVAAAGCVVALGANFATETGFGPFAVAETAPGVITLPIFLAVAIVTSFVVASMAGDLADRDEVERLLTHQATHDDLTGLANRTLFRRRLTAALADPARTTAGDRKSTRLNSKSLMRISYAVFCLKKKTDTNNTK